VDGMTRALQPLPRSPRRHNGKSPHPNFPARPTAIAFEKFVMPGLVPGIHVVVAGMRESGREIEPDRAAWMAGTSPAMTEDAMFQCASPQARQGDCSRLARAKG
jgi:hypothetical protein